MFSLEHMDEMWNSSELLPVGTMTLGSWDTSSAGEELSARRLGTEHSNETHTTMKHKISAHAHTHTRTHAPSTVWVRVPRG